MRPYERKSSLKTKRNTKVHLKKSLVADTINPQDYSEIRFIFGCEECSFFDQKANNCTMGHHYTPHLKANQIKSYELTGKMFICRDLEID